MTPQKFNPNVSYKNYDTREVAGASPQPIQEMSKTKTVYDRLEHWTSPSEGIFKATGSTTPDLPTGVYEIQRNDQIGLFFQAIKTKVDNLIEFPDSKMKEVVGEIQHFWDSESVYRKYDIPYRRGILMYGPQGSGKTSTIRFIIKDVIERGGVVINFRDPHLFKEGIRMLRNIEPEKPIVVLLEDIDDILRHQEESEILNILDGNEEVDRMVFLATTNFPENIKARISNRPSRFDKRIMIDYPNAESRKVYFEHLFSNKVPKKVNLDEWVEQTDKFSLAHMKELFVSVMIYDKSVEESVQNLKDMKVQPKSNDGFASQETSMGFH